MHFQTTLILLETIQTYIENSSVEIMTENKDWRNRYYESDYITIDALHNVGFEVLAEEITVFFFTDHYHFEDYSSECQEGEEDYVERAKVFLTELFECKIRHIEYYKGKTLSSEKYFLLYNDGRKAERIGNTWFGLLRFINPFGKKSTLSTIWQFDQSKGVFTTEP